MATYALNSNGGSDGDTGVSTGPTDFTHAWATFNHAATSMAAGDTLYVASEHAESALNPATFTLPGTVAAPNYILGVNKTSGALERGAAITSADAVSVLLSGFFYVYGVIFTAGAGGSGVAAVRTCYTSKNHQIFENCHLITNNTNVSSYVSVGAGGFAEWIDTAIKFAVTQHFIDTLNAKLRWRNNGASVNPGFLSGSANPGYVFSDVNMGMTDIVVEGVDFSNLGTTFGFWRGGTGGMYGRREIRNCKLPASWAGTVCGATNSSAEDTCAIWNVDNAGNNYGYRAQNLQGAESNDTTHYLNATDGVTPRSRKVVTQATYPSFAWPFTAHEHAFWNGATGASKTLTVEIAQEGGSNLNDNDVWLEAEYLGASGNPLGSIATSRPNILASPSALPSSSAGWTGFSSPTKQKMSVSFTPQLKGHVIWRVRVAKASVTVYYDPKATFA